MNRAKGLAVALVAVALLLTIGFGATAQKSDAWSVDYNATRSCTHDVSAWFKNTEPSGSQWTMDVTVKGDTQVILSGQDHTWQYNNDTDTQVVFDLTWHDGRSGTDRKVATIHDQDGCTTTTTTAPVTTTTQPVTTTTQATTTTTEHVTTTLPVTTTTEHVTTTVPKTTTTTAVVTTTTAPVTTTTEHVTTTVPQTTTTEHVTTTLPVTTTTAVTTTTEKHETTTSTVPVTSTVPPSSVANPTTTQGAVTPTTVCVSATTGTVTVLTPECAKKPTGALPVTGSNTWVWVVLGILLVGAGTAIVLSARQVGDE